jgi:hypothetical protein
MGVYSARCEESRENIRQKLERIGIVPLDARVADRWGTLKSGQDRRAG